MQKEIRNFIGWELASQDTIDFKKCYVDLADDLIGGLLLSQIVYWHLPSKDSGKTKLRVKKEGHLWIAKGRGDWYDEIRISPKQYDRAIAILKKKDLVETKLFKFNANPTTHVRLKWETFLGSLNALIDQNNAFDPLGAMVIDETGITDLPFGEKGVSPLGNNDIDETGISLTESTNKEYPTKNKKIVNKEINKNNLIDMANSFYSEMAPSRWSKKAWGIVTNKLIDELLEREQIYVVNDPLSYIEGCLKNICYKNDLKNGKIELNNFEDMPFHYDWLNE